MQILLYVTTQHARMQNEHMHVCNQHLFAAGMHEKQYTV
jgi:hypothetical protein